MLPAEGTDDIHDPIHFPEGHTVHSLVQILKGGFHGIGIGVVAFVVACFMVSIVQPRLYT